MKKSTLVAFVLGVTIGSAGVGVAASNEFWLRNGVFCYTTGTGTSRGVACQVATQTQPKLKTSDKMVIVNQRQIIVSRRTSVLYVTPSR